MEAVAIAEFALDQIAWAEELDLELTEQELAILGPNWKTED